METKKMIINAILIAIGVILHVISPSLGLAAQPDFALAMLFIVMLLNKDYKTTLFSGIIIGIFTALTTKTVGGQLPNIIDKIITCNVMFLILALLRDKVSKNLQSIILMFLGTFLSGVVFLSSLALIYGIHGGIVIPILVIVVPTALINTVFGLIIYKIVLRVLRQINFKM